MSSPAREAAARPSLLVPLVAGLGLILILLLAIVAASVAHIHSLGDQLTAIVAERNAKSALAMRMHGLHRSRYQSLLLASQLADPFERDDELASFAALAREFILARERFTALPLDEKELVLWDAVRRDTQVVEQRLAGILDDFQQAPSAALLQRIQHQVGPLQRQMMAHWEALLTLQEERNRQAVTEARDAEHRIKRAALGLGIAALLVGAVVATLVVRASRRLEQELTEEKENAQITLGAIADAVIRLDEQGRITYLNRAAENLLGLGGLWRTPGTAQTVIHLHDHASRASLTESLLSEIRRGSWVTLPPDTYLTSAQGMEYAVEGSAAPIAADHRGVRGTVLVLRDVSEFQESMRWRKEQSRLDPVTGLPEAAVLEERLAKMLLSKRSADRPLAYLEIHLPNLDTLLQGIGSAGRDELHRQLSRLLYSRIRDSDLLARLTTDRFGILLANCPAEAAERIVLTLQQGLQAYRFTWRDQEYPIEVRIGEVHAPPFTGSLDECQAAVRRDGENRAAPLERP